MTNPTRGQSAAWLMLIVPALLLLAFIAAYGVNGPTWDHLSSAEIFDRWYGHRLTLAFLFRQHNEHRKAVPRLVVLALGLLTRFNNRDEMYLQWALLCATVTILLRAFRPDVRLGQLEGLLAFLPVGWMMVSLRPYDVLLVGDGLLTYLSMVFILGAFFLLVFGQPGWRSFAGAAACGLLTSFSQSNGLLVWPIGALVLASDLRAVPRRDGAAARLLGWAVIGAATTTAYFHGYQDPGNHPTASFVLRHPAIGLKHFLTVTGGSLSPDSTSALTAGLVVTALELFWGAVLLSAWWRDRARPPFGAWLFVLAVPTQIMITLNRAGFGIAQALSPRYAAYSCFGPIGVYWCAVAFRDRLRPATPLATSAATLLVVGYLAGSIGTWEIRNDWYIDKHWKAYLLYAAKYQPPSVLGTVYPNPVHTLAYADIMERFGLNVFAERHLRAQDLVRTEQIPQFSVESINGDSVEAHARMEVEAGEAIVVRGWALDPSGRLAAPAVFGAIDGVIDIPGGVGMARERFNDIPYRLRWTAFGVSFGGFVVPPGEHTLALKIVMPDRVHYYLTPPIARIIRK